MALGCSGVSIVWNAVNGFLMQQLVRAWPEQRPELFACAALLAGVAVDVYYSVTADLLTTIAHGCALVLGALLGACSPSRPSGHMEYVGFAGDSGTGQAGATETNARR